MIIENQLERTDHDHLGKLLTYAAGLGAKVVVWVAEEISDDHRRTLDWLNEITGESFPFFALEIELWRINESQPAPTFGSPKEFVGGYGNPSQLFVMGGTNDRFDGRCEANAVGRGAGGGWPRDGAGCRVSRPGGGHGPLPISSPGFRAPRLRGRSRHPASEA